MAALLGSSMSLSTRLRGSRARVPRTSPRQAVRTCAMVGKGSPNLCSIVPYFKVKEGKLADFKDNVVNGFYPLMKDEDKCLFYNFTFNGDVAHCREVYEDSEGLLFHLANVKEPFDKALEMADLFKLEVHGPQAELDKLYEPLKDLPVEYFKQTE